MKRRLLTILENWQLVLISIIFGALFVLALRDTIKHPSHWKVNHNTSTSDDDEAALLLLHLNTLNP